MINPIAVIYNSVLKPSVSWHFRILTHPIAIFVILQLVCIATSVLWVVWFIDQDAALLQVSQSFSEYNLNRSYGLGLLIAGCILLGVILVGTIFLFVFGLKQSKLNRQQQNFISSVTHELRSPLSSIQLAFETLRLRNLSAAASQQLHTVVLSDIDRLKRLVDQILLSAKLDRGMLDIKKVERLEVKTVINSAITKSSHLQVGLNHRISLECDDALVIESSPDAIDLVLGNLLENAVKYSPRNSPIRIVASDVGKFVRIEVIDQGFGLSPRDFKRVFKMFHRAEVATKKAIPGTGLGLFIVQNIVRSLGGNISVSSLGKDMGSTFTVLLPVQLEK